MKWPLVFLLSMFGLAMGVLTVFVIPSTVEPLVWLAIFAVCAYVIASRYDGKHFLHGLCVGLLNSVWITAAHVLFFDAYIANHAEEAEMMSSMPLPDSPRLMMMLVGPVIGLVSGAVLGLLAYLVGKFVKPRPSA